MKDFPLEPDVVMLAATDQMLHLTISFESRSIVESLQNYPRLEKLLDEMVDLGLIIRPNNEVRDNGK